MSDDGNDPNNGNENGGDDSDLDTEMDNGVKSKRKQNRASQKHSTLNISGSGDYSFQGCQIAPGGEQLEYKHDDKSTHNTHTDSLRKSKSESNNSNNQNGSGLSTPVNARNFGRGNNRTNSNNNNNNDNTNTMPHDRFVASAFTMSPWDVFQQFVTNPEFKFGDGNVPVFDANKMVFDVANGNENGNGNGIMNSKVNTNSEQLQSFMRGANSANNNRKNSENKSNSGGSDWHREGFGSSNTSDAITCATNNDGNCNSSAGYSDFEHSSIRKQLFPPFGSFSHGGNSGRGYSDRGTSGINNSNNRNNNNNNNTNNGSNHCSNVFGGGVAVVRNGNTNMNSGNDNSNRVIRKNLTSIAGGIDIGGGASGTRETPDMRGGAGGQKDKMPHGATFLPRGTALNPTSASRVQGTPLQSHSKKNIKTWNELTKEQENNGQQEVEPKDYYQIHGGEYSSSMHNNNDNHGKNESEQKTNVGSLEIISGRYEHVRNRRVERLTAMLVGNKTPTVTTNNKANARNDHEWNEMNEKSNLNNGNTGNEVNTTEEIDRSEGNIRNESGMSMNMNVNMNMNENKESGIDLENDEDDPSNDINDNANENTNNNNTSDTEMELELTSNVIPFRDVNIHRHHDHHHHHEQQRQRHDKTPRMVIRGKRRNTKRRDGGDDTPPHHATPVEYEGLRVPPGTLKRKFHSAQKAPRNHKNKMQTQSRSQGRSPLPQSQLRKWS